VVLLSAAEPARLATALERGVKLWLPRDLALAHPPLVSAALRQAVEWTDLRLRCRRVDDALNDCRRQVNRFVDLLWETASLDPRTGWCTQRHMMDRLQEEIARSMRFGTRFSVALGELQIHREDSSEPAEETALPAWVAERIVRAKRRCDAIGHYGPHCFLMLLVNTNQDGAMRCCRRILDVLSRTPAELGLTAACFGVAASPPDGGSTKSLLSTAEQRLEDAWAQGGDSSVC
jgi:diguanylate cyclase (GGDEF)-like protein